MTELHFETTINRLPGLACVVRPEGACRGNRDEDALRMASIQHNGMETHTAGARLPQTSLRVAQSRQLLPRLSTVYRAKQGGILNSGIDCIWIGERGF